MAVALFSGCWPILFGHPEAKATFGDTISRPDLAAQYTEFNG
jgi:hypothetical protein